MHYNLDGNVSTAASVSTSGMHPVVSSMHHEMLASHDPVVSLQAQLMMDTLRQPFSSSSPSMVTPPRLIPSAYDTHRVPGSPASLHGYPAVTSYSPLVAADVETPSPGGCVPSPHTPRNAVKNLLAEQKMKTEPTSTPPPEEELAKYFDIKPLLRKPIDTTRMTNEQVDRLKKRRDRNRAAATRCRVKRREKARNIRHELAEFTTANDELEREMIQLQEEKLKLEAMLAMHAQVQRCKIANEAENDNFASSESHSDCSADFDTDSALFAMANYDIKPVHSFSERLSRQRPPRLDFGSHQH